MSWDRIKERLDKLLQAGRHGELRGALMMLNEVDIAEYLQTLAPDKVLLVFRLLPKDISADVFSYMDDDQREKLMESISDEEISRLVDEMFIDDAVDFLEELPAGVGKRILAACQPEKREVINQFLRYPANSAGSIMTIEFCEFHQGITVRAAMDEIRRTALDKETLNTLYVMDMQRKLIGTIPLRKLILAQEDTIIDDLMTTNFISVTTTDDQEFVADTVRKYDLICIPVVDKEGRLVGIVTVDDAIDVIEEENTEDIETMAALLPSEDEYLKTGVVTLAKNRIPWLLFLMLSAIITGMIITRFEDLLMDSGAIGVALTACIPMLMGTGGNCGSQASTLVIRGLALGELEMGDILKIWWKEVRVAVMVGAVLSVINFARLYFLSHLSLAVSGVVSVSMFLTVLIAKSIGCTLPILAKRIKLDPALMASPLITSIMDACSLLILFSIATSVLHLG